MVFSQIVNKYQVVRQIPIFNKLNWFELHTVASKSSFAEYKKGEIICQEGAPPDAFYCVISGRVQAFKTRPTGEKEDIELLHRGMHFGIISLLTGEQHSLTFQALNDSVILKINKDDFATILRSIPQLGVEFSRSLSRRLRSEVVKTKRVFESTIISIYSPVKGTGSSTFAINFALALAKEPRRKVIFVNINSNQAAISSAESLDSSPRWKRPAILLKDIVGDYQKIMNSIYRGEVPVALLNVTVDPKDQPIIRQISRFISSLANDYHYVVVDLPNDMDDVVLETLTQSDQVYLVTQDQHERLLLAAHVIDRLKEALKDHFDKEKIQVLISGLEAKCYLSFAQINGALNHSVTMMLPFISPGELKNPFVSDAITILLPDPHSDYAKTVDHLARRVGGVLVGLVLGGGAALGLAHIGVIRVLEKEKIPIDMVVGSSIGSLIGALWATGKNADELESCAREFETKKSMSKLIDLVFPKAGFVAGKAIEKWLRGHLGNKTFFSTRVPLKIVAYDLLHREELVLSEGSLVDAVRQSIAIPGVIEPVLQKDKLIIDGGVLNPLPTNVLVSQGIKKIIAVNVLQSPAEVAKSFEEAQFKIAEEEKIRFRPNPGKYISIHSQRIARRLFWPNISDIIVRSLQATEFVISQQSAAQADIVIHPDVARISWFALYEVTKLIRCGEEAAYKLLPEIKKLTVENSTLALIL